ncbi:MAG TPA: triose-phosphate isomerase [Porphyromonadaceae bacterium]|nr:triose-phosphate isomerase [Porphyromonadaceae bacterium]
MRKKVLAGNWKMHMGFAEGMELLTKIKEGLAGETPKCEVIIGTPFIHLAAASELVKDTPIKISAQNCSDREWGALTGEVCAGMIVSTGAKYVILGHSERRSFFNETPDLLRAKIDRAMSFGLSPIFCVGENLKEREAGEQLEVVRRQIEASLFEMPEDAFRRVIIAYEPIWAIGTGKVATMQQAEEMHAYIRKIVNERFGEEIAEDCSILYGGSCNPNNAKDIFANPDVDGGLIGGASLKSEDFLKLIEILGNK